MLKSLKVLLSVLVMLLFFSNGNAQNVQKEKFTFSVFGDLPYYLPDDFPRFENLIKQLNTVPSSFNIHVGDFKSSSTPCSDDAFLKMKNYFGTFKKPLIYTPGDNEWTDCHKKDAGAFKPEERLDQIRRMFFSSPESFGIEKLPLISQSSMPSFKKFVENNRWDYGKIAFATFHAVGSNNNFLPSNTTTFNQEFYERDAANVAWIKEVFKKAKENQMAGIVLSTQADMFGENKDLGEASGFINIVKTLKEESMAFGKPVLLINGDSHRFLIDKPILQDKKNRKTLMNFTRLQGFGESDMHAVTVNINYENPNLFEINQFIIEGN